MRVRNLDDPDGRSHSRHGSQDKYSERTDSVSPSQDSEASNVLVHTMLDSHRRDLFSSYPAMAGRYSMESVDECKAAALCFEATQLIQADFYIQRNEELLLKIRPDAQHPVLSVLFPMSMQDPGLFKCFLVGAQSLYEWRRFPHQAQGSQIMMRLQSEAISSLQKRLTLPAAHMDDGLVISVLHLMVADVSLGKSSIEPALTTLQGMSARPAITEISSRRYQTDHSVARRPWGISIAPGNTRAPHDVSCFRLCHEPQCKRAFQSRILYCSRSISPSQSRRPDCRPEPTHPICAASLSARHLPLHFHAACRPGRSRSLRQSECPMY